MRCVWFIVILSVVCAALAVLYSANIAPPVPVAKPMLLWENSAGPRRSRVYVAFSPDGKCLASGSNKGDISLWDPQTGRLLRTMRAVNNSGSDIVFSPDSKYLATSGQISTLLDVSTGKPAHKLQPGEASSLSFSPDGKLLAGGGDRITVWDTSTGNIVRRLGRPGDTYPSVGFSPDGRILAYADHYKLRDGGYVHQTRLWDVRQGRTIHTFDGVVGCLAFSPDGRILSTRADGGSAVRMWCVQTGKRLRTFVDWREIGCPSAVDFSPDSKLIAVGGSAAPYSRWSPYYHKLLGEHPPDRVPGGAVALADVQTGRVLWKDKVGRVDRVFSVDISPDGKLLAAGVAWDAKVMVRQIR